MNEAYENHLGAQTLTKRSCLTFCWCKNYLGMIEHIEFLITLFPWAGNFLSVTKKWNSSDKLALQLPISLRTEAIKGKMSEAWNYDQFKFFQICGHLIMVAYFPLVAMDTSWIFQNRSVDKMGLFCLWYVLAKCRSLLRCYFFMILSAYPVDWERDDLSSPFQFILILSTSWWFTICCMDPSALFFPRKHWTWLNYLAAIHICTIYNLLCSSRVIACLYYKQTEILIQIHRWPTKVRISASNSLWSIPSRWSDWWWLGYKIQHIQILRLDQRNPRDL